MRSSKDKNIQNQKVDYHSDRLSNLISNNDNGDIDKEKNFKTWVGIFKNMGRNFPARNFLGGNFRSRNSPGGKLIGWNFSGESFPDTVIIIKQADLSYSLIESQLIPCIPACGYKFHALATYLHPPFTAPS